MRKGKKFALPGSEKERKRRNIFPSQDLQIKSQGIFKKEFI